MKPVESTSRKLAAKFGAEDIERLDINIDEIFAKEIAHELLLERNSTISDEEVDKIWAMCTTHNPFDAPILYELIRVSNESK